MILGGTQPQTPDSSTPLLGRSQSCSRSSWKAPFRVFVDDNVGLLLVGLAQFFLAIVNVIVKHLNGIDDPVPTLEFILVRMSITYVFSVFFMWWNNIPDPILGPKGVRLLLVFRGCSGFFGIFGIYFSLSYLSLSDATVLTFLSPIFTGISGAIFLKEHFTMKEALAGICSFFGVVLIARPSFLFGDSAPVPGIPAPSAPDVRDVVLGLSGAGNGTSAERLMAVGVALLGVLGATGAYTSIRAIGKRAHALHSLAFFSSQSVFVSAIGMIVMRVPVVIPTRWDWILMLSLVGIFGFCAQVLLTMGLQREAAGRAALALYLGIVYALVFERIFFRVTPSALSMCGTTIIMGCAAFTALTKKKAQPIVPEPIDSTLEQGLLDTSETDVSVHGTQGDEYRTTKITTGKGTLVGADVE